MSAEEEPRSFGSAVEDDKLIQRPPNANEDNSGHASERKEEEISDSTSMFIVALGIIDSVIFFGDRTLINLHQCKRLVDFYKRARQFFDVLKKRRVFVDNHLYNETLDVLNKGQYLVYGYLNASWVKSMKAAGVNQDAFAKIYVELEDCFWLICEKVEAGLVVNSCTNDAFREHKGHEGSYSLIGFDTLAPLYFLDEDSRASLFERDAQRDKEHMLQMIKGSGALCNMGNMFQRIESTRITIEGLKARLKRKQSLFVRLELKNTRDCEKEVQRLDVGLKSVDDNGVTLESATNLVGFVPYGQSVLYDVMDMEEEGSNTSWNSSVENKGRKREEHGVENSEQEESKPSKAMAKGKLKMESVEKEKAEDQLWRADELLEKMEAENLMKKKEVEDLWRKKKAGELLRKKLKEELWKKEEALAKEKLKRKQVEKELLELKLVLQPKELEQEKHDMKVLRRRDSKLPQDFKIRSREIFILQTIGSGGFATIHKCRWQNYDFAVKIFEGGDVDDLIAEVQNLVLLPRHPNIVQLVGFSIHGKHEKPMLVMELLDGDLHSMVCTDEPKKKQRLTQTLSGLWKKLSGQLGLSTRIRIDFIYQIAKGMLFLHNRKIFHGDLKGKNVLVKLLPGDRIQLKVADFGLSEKLLVKREHSDNDSSIELNCSHHSNHSSLGFRHGSGKGKAQVLGNVGTLRWMAPEVYGVTGGDIKPYSMKADVYSFSMTCVEILTRQHPFPDIHSPEEIRQHVNSGGRPNLQMVKDVPQALLMLVETCWNADPFCRPDFSKIYSRMQELKKQFPIN